MRVVGCLLGVLSIANVSADVLVLDNGDRISGELQSMSEGKLTWKSDKFGEIEVKQASVSQVETRGQYQITVGRDPAYSNCLLSIQGGVQTMLCDEQVVNIADWRLVSEIATMQFLDRDVIEFTGEASIGLEESSGNLREEGYDMETKLGLRYAQTQHRIKIEYDNRETDDVQTKDQRKLDYGFDWFFTDTWFINANGRYERNEFTNLLQSKSAGFGMGLQPIDNNIMKLRFNVGLSHVDTTTHTDGDKEFNSLRWEFDYDWVLTGNGSKFFHDHQLFQSFDQSDNWVWESETGISVPINGRLKSILKFEYDYRNLPSEEHVPYDRMWSLGIGYDW